MAADRYREALDAATKEYEELGARRREIDDRLMQLAQTIGTLMRLLGLTPTVPLGLTDACRLTLRGAGLPLTPLEVRDRLLGIGVDLSTYSNDLSAIHHPQAAERRRRDPVRDEGTWKARVSGTIGSSRSRTRRRRFAGFASGP
jgi:hypothetical protein